MVPLLSSVLLLPLLTPSILVAGKSSTDRFGQYYSQSFPLKLDDNKFTALTNAPRDYATIVLLTAMDPKFGCKACHDFQPDWDLVSRVWQKGDRKGESRLIFAELDFINGRNTFQSLNLQHAPVLYLYPPTEGPNARPDGKAVRFDFTSPPTAENLHAWLSRQLPQGPKPAFERPFNWVKFTTYAILSLGLVTLVAIATPHIMPILQNRNVWAAGSLLAVLLFTSGHMFNHIRQVPYVAGDGKGGVSYFAGGFQNQYGMETQIIACIYGILSFAAINLALKCPRIVDPRSQQVAVLAWAGVIYVVYSFLLNIFRWKNGGYPFYLPPF